VVWLERAKIGEKPLSVLKFSTAPSTFHNFKQKCGASEKTDRNCHVFANSRWAIFPLLLLAESGY
jgi:hypothetical protein